MTTRFSLIKLLAVFGLLVYAQLATVLAAVTFTNTPAAVSNTYPGTITLQIAGLTNTEMVVVRKYLDLNRNGVVDAGEPLVQQFSLTDGQAGMVIAGVTNLNVPGDLNSTTGAITATLNFRNGDFVQNISAGFLYVLYSPGAHFTPITNSFSVTNFPFAQQVTGNVVSNGTAVTVPYAVVMLFPPPSGSGGGPNGYPLAAGVANASGKYTIPVPPGTYVPLAYGSNYIGSYNTSLAFTLAPGQNLTNNLTLTNATSSLSGSLVDANNSGVRLPGVWLHASSSSLIAIGFSDPNGNFILPVSSGSWKLNADETGLIVHGYLSSQNGTNLTAGTAGYILTATKATTLFYGSVKDTQGNPLPGLSVSASDDSLYQSSGYSDANGNYVTGVVGGLGANDPWQLYISSTTPLTNYIVSQPVFSNNGTNLSNGTAILGNFIALLATNQISGTVKDSNGNPIAGVGVGADTTINGTSYQAYVDTGTNGAYAFNVANGAWSVWINNGGGSDSLNNLLGNGQYQNPNNQNVTISNHPSTVNFTVQLCAGVQILVTNLPSGQNGVYYDQFLQAVSCSSSFTWSVVSGFLPPGLTINSSNGEISGTPTYAGPFMFTVRVTDGNSLTADQTYSVSIAEAVAPLQITTASLTNATQNAPYSQTLNATGGQPPYAWLLVPGSANLPAGLSLTTNGVISGTPIGAGTSQFIVAVYDATSAWTYQILSLTVNPSSLPQAITLAVVGQPGHGTFEFSFSIAAGVTYTVQSSTDLKNWSAFETFNFSNSVPASGGSWTVTVPATASRSFYRVKVGP